MTTRHELYDTFYFKTRGCGLSIFLADREIQWYDEPFPDCCTKEADDQVSTAAISGI